MSKKDIFCAYFDILFVYYKHSNQQKEGIVMPDTVEKVYVKEKGNGIGVAGLVTGVAALTGVAAKWLGNALDRGDFVGFRHGHAGGFHDVERLAKVEAFQVSDKENTALRIENAALRQNAALEVFKAEEKGEVNKLKEEIKTLKSYINLTPSWATTVSAEEEE